MTYDDLVARLAHQTGLHSDLVKKVLVHLPDALMELTVGGSVRTPLGVFRRTRRKTRQVVLPDGKTSAMISEMSVVKLKPGSRLRSGEGDPD